jgi:uncharacterized protein YuzB (UPF0349 family)
MNLFKCVMKKLPSNEYSLSRCMYAECASEELSRVVVLDSRPVEGDTVNELVDNQTLLLKENTWMARAIYKCSRQDLEAAYG